MASGLPWATPLEVQKIVREYTLQAIGPELSNYPTKEEMAAAIALAIQGAINASY